MHNKTEQLKKELADRMDDGHAERAAIGRLEQWSAKQAATIVAALRQP